MAKRVEIDDAVELPFAEFAIVYVALMLGVCSDSFVNGNYMKSFARQEHRISAGTRTDIQKSDLFMEGRVVIIPRDKADKQL